MREVTELREKELKAKDDRVAEAKARVVELEAKCAKLEQSNLKHRSDAEKCHGLHTECRSDHQKMFDALVAKLMSKD